MPRSFKSAKVLTGQRGFSIVELSIAVLIALFLLGGLVTLVMGTRRTNATQSALSQLQDNQRIAMTLISNMVQQAGYFPNPVTQQLSTFGSETMAGVAMGVGQVMGATTTAPGGDTFVVRFYAPPNDTTNSIINCAGQSNSGSGSTTVWYSNAFLVGTVGSTSWLQCQVRTSGAGAVLTINLIPNVTNLTVLYGVASSAAGDDYSVIQYLTAGQMSAATWPNVTAVKVTLTFLVPQYGSTGGQMTTSTQTFQRVIPVMSRVGVDT